MRSGLVLSDLVWSCLILSGLALSGVVWPCLVFCCLVLSCVLLLGVVRCCLVFVWRSVVWPVKILNLKPIKKLANKAFLGETQ